MASQFSTPAKVFRGSSPIKGNEAKTVDYGNAVPSKPSGGPSIKTPLKPMKKSY